MEHQPKINPIAEVKKILKRASRDNNRRNQLHITTELIVQFKERVAAVTDNEGGRYSKGQQSAWLMAMGYLTSELEKLEKRNAKY